MNSRTLWNDNWYFAKTALGVNWEDRQIWEAKMQPVDLPHDWLIYDTKNLYEDSIGWYRKNFAYAPDKTGNDDRVILRFEGVYMDPSQTATSASSVPNKIPPRISVGYYGVSARGRK